MGSPREGRPLPLRCFLLATTPEEGRATLLPEDVEHAVKVLRLGAGDRIRGLDGRGRSWALEVVAASRRELELRALDDPRRDPAPGTPGARLPWIELHLPLPRGPRAERMLERLTQLGLSRLVPLLTRRTAPHARDVTPGRLERLRRAAREAVKQCRRSWLPEVAEAEPLTHLLDHAGTRLLLAPDARRKLIEVLDLFEGSGSWSREAPLILIAGPEGGFDAEESEALLESGVERARLGPYTMRIETAAEAAVAIAVHRTT